MTGIVHQNSWEANYSVVGLAASKEKLGALETARKACT